MLDCRREEFETAACSATATTAQYSDTAERLAEIQDPNVFPLGEEQENWWRRPEVRRCILDIRFGSSIVVEDISAVLLPGFLAP
jgi:hypothetical protein